jgi:hypothetical protein
LTTDKTQIVLSYDEWDSGYAYITHEAFDWKSKYSLDKSIFVIMVSCASDKTSASFLREEIVNNRYHQYTVWVMSEYGCLIKSKKKMDALADNVLRLLN